MYVSELITTDAIDTWRGNSRILLKSSCGTGKTKFVTEKFYGYAKQRHKKILILTNRRFLKQQTEKDCEGKEDVITIKTYQSLEQNLDYANRMLHKYDYIVADEAHYFFSDSVLFNSTSYRLMSLLKQLDRPVIFMTATPEVLERWITFNEENKFDIQKPPQVDKFYYFRNPAAIGRLLGLIPLDEKTVCFCSDLRYMEELYNQYKDDSMFVCSESQAHYYRKYVDKNVVQNWAAPNLCTKYRVSGGGIVKVSYTAYTML
ncbi:DEAD/DEAH box helicase family protein [Christensenella minuta]|uniref:DEAD/DEAH box helicase family protein n=1 Tax=Christensenella minuta TaxID=626937 RepID=UPI002157818F|nr:DEAD/DEAH box helicase family protein [Christensenella minuta]